MATPLPLPESVTRRVGRQGVWQEDRVTLIDGEAVLLPTQEAHLVVGARWARPPGSDEPRGETLGLVQYLMERPDGTSRWTNPVLVD